MDVKDPGRELLVLRLGKAHFGAWVDEVLEIVRTPPISRLPLAHPEVLGVTSVRGAVLPVLDLGARLLGVPAVPPGRLVLIRHHDSGSLVGLLVDGADRLLDVHPGELQKPPAAAEARLPAELVTGVVSRDEGVVTVLHIGRAAAPPVPANDERK
jgi:purine-binding chemotaxis protein CheW